MTHKMHMMHQWSTHKNERRAFEDRLSAAQYRAMRLAEIRKSKGLSQRDLAEMIGMDQATVQRAEKADKTAKLQTYALCADRLGVPLYELFLDDRGALESGLILAFRSASDADKERIAAVVEALRLQSS